MQQQAKPICLVKKQVVDRDFLSRDINMLQEHLRKMMPDYHVFVIPMKKVEGRDWLELECFYEKDFTEENKGHIENILKQLIREYESQEKQSEPKY